MATSNLLVLWWQAEDYVISPQTKVAQLLIRTGEART